MTVSSTLHTSGVLLSLSLSLCYHLSSELSAPAWTNDGLKLPKDTSIFCSSKIINNRGIRKDSPEAVPETKEMGEFR
jgi:hypothetical protein